MEDDEGKGRKYNNLKKKERRLKIIEGRREGKKGKKGRRCRRKKAETRIKNGKEEKLRKRKRLKRAAEKRMSDDVYIGKKEVELRKERNEKYENNMSAMRKKKENEKNLHKSRKEWNRKEERTK